MRNYILKIASGLLGVCMFLSTNAQKAETAHTVSTNQPAQIREDTPAKGSTKEMNQRYLDKAADMTQKISGIVTLTDGQKANMQASILEAFKAFEQKRIDLKGDDTQIPAIKAQLLEDIKARLKTMLTAQQYDLVLSKMEAKD